MYRKFLVFLLFSALFLIAGCDLPSAAVATQIPILPLEFRAEGFEKRFIGDPIPVEVNWCGGTGDFIITSNFSFSRSVTVRIAVEGEIVARFGPEALSGVTARVAAYHGTEVGNLIDWLWGGAANTTPGTHVRYQLQISELWQVGTATLEIPGLGQQSSGYEVLTGFATDVVGSEQISCDSIVLNSTITPITTTISATATLTLPATFTGSIYDNFSDQTWFNTPRRYRNFGGVCQYDSDGSRGLLRSTQSGFCAFTVVGIDGREQIQLRELVTYSLEVSIDQSSGYIGQGIGLSGPAGWWLVCTLRQDAGQNIPVFEVQSPANFNLYGIASAAQAMVSLSIDSGNLVCMIGGQVIGRVPLSALPFASETLVTRVINSDRPDGSALTTIDDLSISP